MTISRRPLLAAAATCALCAGAASPAFAQSSVGDANTLEPGFQPYPTAANGEGLVKDGYATARWSEDWTSKADPANRDDPLDRLKFLPLDANGDVYLTLSGELRLRSNYTSNPGLKKGEHQRQDIVRASFGADLHIGKHVRLYGELAHADSTGHNVGTPSIYQENDLVAQQYFAEVSGELGGVTLGARYGRQMFWDGPKYLVSQRDNNAIHYTENGLRLWARTKDARIDLFDFSPTGYGRQGLGDDTIRHDIRYSGFTAGFNVPRDVLGGSNLYLDPFVWRVRRREATWLSGTAREERLMAGVHAYGKVGRVAIDWTVDHQSGSFGANDIDAWQVFMDQSYALSSAKGAPTIGLSFDYASGGSQADGTLNSAYALHGANTPFSHHLFLYASNLVETAPTFTIKLSKSVKLLGEYAFAWRADTHDAIYRSSGKALSGTSVSNAKKTAELPRLQIDWKITPRVSITARYEHVFAARGLTDAGYGDSDFLASWISMKF